MDFNILRQHKMEHLFLGKHREAAVLIPLLQKNGEWHLLFEVRAQNIAQGGEICFPGGGVEKGETGEEAAVRETMEELLVSRKQIDVICPMFEMTGPGGAEVKSYLGVFVPDSMGSEAEMGGLSGEKASARISDSRSCGYTFSRDEVAAVFTLPLSWFDGHPVREYQAELVTQVPDDFPFEELPGGRNYPFRKVPRTFCFYETEYGPIWGMTAQIVHAALPLLQV